MRIKQYVYFSVFSESSTAEEIATFLGLLPDKVSVRGSRVADPPRPQVHSWELVCDAPGLRIDEQVSTLFERLRAIEERLTRIGPELLLGSGGCALQLVRYFDDDDGEDDDLSPPDAPLQKLSGQHQLLGWHLDADSLQFLGRVGAEIDAEEYG